jgi:site-specific DNA-methyltransferase (adenine-specific)/adenine-specific DNA-methyltransferase
MHDIIGKKITKKFYIVCPASKVDFIEDVVRYDNIEYYILRVPYSIISELHKRPFDKIHQPVSEKDVNNTIDAVGFDFIQIPKIELDYKKSDYSIHIKTFESKTISKKPLELENLESLSMVIIDYNYN